MKNDLSFRELREANLNRCREFKDALGRLCHQNGVDDWSPEMWAVAMMGELGELCNQYKKYVRGDIDNETFFAEAKKEFPDIVCYLDLFAARCGVDLWETTIDKFNEVSDRVDSTVKLDKEGGGPPLDVTGVTVNVTKLIRNDKGFVTGERSIGQGVLHVEDDGSVTTIVKG